MKLPRLFSILSILILVTAGAALAAFPIDPPDDPAYAPDARCPDPRGELPSGQWNLFSDQSGCPLPLHGSGISANLAWQVTQGHPDVVIGILDSGVDYDHEDLRDKIWLNRGELPFPSGTCLPPFGDPHDCNGDGVFNVEDYAASGIADLNGTADIDRGDLRVFADGIDDDGNGYVDDLSGWDSADDDGDEFDHRFFGHGTGRAGIVGPETNNTLGVAGICPVCPLMNLRIDDTFVHTSEGVAKGAIYAIDNGAKVLNMSLGGTTASRLSRGAFTYAMAHDVLAVNASANEFSYHQNFQAVFDDVMTIGAVTPDNRTNPTTWKQKANFANYGAHLDVVGPSLVPGASQSRDADFNPTHNGYTETASGTSSSTPHAAGVGALVYSEAIEDGISPPLSAQEVRHIISLSADDVGVGEMTPPYTPVAGWDKWSGYGRVNAKAAVDMVSPTTIPPEADINSPDWYSLVDGKVQVSAYANARRAAGYDWVLEVGTGVEPTSFTRIDGATAVPSQPGVSSADLITNLEATWDVGALTEGMYTLRLRVTDNLLPANDSEDRMAVWVRHDDPDDLPGFPRFLDGSLESLSVALVDLDADNDLETVFTDGNGEIHALRSDGSELPGFPVHAQPPANLPLTKSPAFDGSQANGEVPVSYASMFAGPAVADIDGDDVQEIVVSASDGRLYCWNADGSVCQGSWPAETDRGFTRDPYGTHAQLPESHPEGIASTPALGNLDADPDLEIVAGTVEQKLYVWNADGSRMAPWPKQLFDAGSASGVSDIAPRAILSSAAIADVDADGANEIVVGTNETYSSPNYNGTTGGSGRVYMLEANGDIAPGWPVKPTSISPSAVPLVAEGVGSSPAVGNVDGDPQLEVAIAVFIGDPAIYNHDGSTARTLAGAFGTTGPGSHDFDETTPEGGLANPADQPSHFYVSQGILANIDGGGLEYLAGTVGNRLIAFAGAELAGQGAGPPAVFDHLLSAWDATNGSPKPNFPRVIEDWQFIIGPSVADIGGVAPGSPEVIDSSGGYFVHAFDRLGLEPAGWPKLTGHWQTSTPAIGDLNEDGKVEVVQTTRLGGVFAWSTPGAVCQSDEWRKFRHDEWNSGTYAADTRRPDIIEDLVGSRIAGKITLTWTAPGDDGPCGAAARYEARASSQPITTANFSQATPIANEPNPVATGTAESFTFNPPQGTRFFALRAIDERGNAAPPVSAGNDPDAVAAGAEAGEPPGSASGPIDGPAGPLCPGMTKVPGNHIVGTPAADDVTGTTGTDIFCGLGGDDRFAGAGGDDVAGGGGGRDDLRGGPGRDRLSGGSGRDRLVGGPGKDTIRGGGSADRCSGSGKDHVRSC